METIALLIKLFIMAAAAITIVYYTSIIGKIKWWLYVYFLIPIDNIRLRPFDCHVCLSFWLSLVYFSIETAEKKPITAMDMYAIVIYSLAASAISHVIYRVMK